ncbi:MAG: outer membrane porin, OprD family [Helicobacteraceae bacterium]|nr:outer membrane porin, OprD family [Helicobacteraceae bacterium]
MNKKILLSVTTIATLSSTLSADSVATMFKDGKVDGQIRSFYIDRAYEGGISSTHRNGLAVGGKLRYETASLNGLSAGVGFYTTQKVASSPTVDKTLFNSNGDGYSLLGEAFLKYEIGNTILKGGRQKLDTPLAGSDDARMVPNLFEAYLAINNDLADTTLIAGHVTAFAPGSFANAYNGGALGATAGYTAVAGNTAKHQGDFTNMGEWAIGENTSGVSVVSATYSGIENVKLQAWDYYAWDILNAIYLQADASFKTGSITPYVAAQYIGESEIGDKKLGDVDSTFWGAKAGAKYSNFNAYVAYSNQSDNTSAAVNGGTITPWGGMPAFTQGMVTRHMFLAGTKATKVAGSYNFKNLGTNLSVTAYYVSFDMDTNNGYTDTTTATEPGFDIKYYPTTVKNLQLRFRGNFPRDFKHTANSQSVDWNEYRFIANYNF